MLKFISSDNKEYSLTLNLNWNKIQFSSSVIDIIVNYLQTDKIDYSKLTVKNNSELISCLEYFHLDHLKHKFSFDVNDLYKLTDEDEEIRNNEFSLIEKLNNNEPFDDTKIQLTRTIYPIYHNIPYLYIGIPQTTEINPNLFHKQFYKHLASILKEFDFKENKLICAGGSVDTTLRMNIYENRLREHQDLDLYLITQDVSIAKQSIERLYVYLKSTLDKEDHIVIVRNNYTITFHIFNSNKKEYRQIQVILRLYNSIAQVISGFDLDSSAVAFDGEHIYAMPRYIRAVQNGYNLIDPKRQSTTYHIRLCKYLSRGYAIADPGLQWNRINFAKLKPTNKVHGIASVLKNLNQKINYQNKSDYQNIILPRKCNYNYKLFVKHFYLTYMQYNFRPYRHKYEHDIDFDKFIEQNNIDIDIFYKLNSNERKMCIASYLNTFKLPYVLSIDSLDPIMNTSTIVNPTQDPFILLCNTKMTISQEPEFISINPGSQSNGSFHPTFHNWYHDIYSYE
jgi:hypothetical protein